MQGQVHLPMGLVVIPFPGGSADACGSLGGPKDAIPAASAPLRKERRWISPDKLTLVFAISFASSVVC